MKYILFFLLLFVVGFYAFSQSPVIYDGWRIMPVRSEEEFNQGAIGGEGEQHMHSITRCNNHPNVIYLAHDVCQIWRSGDGGVTWDKCLCKGMYAHAGLSIEVDPFDSSIVFATVSNSSNYRTNYEGVYRSEDSGKTWDLVLPSKPNYNSSLHRYYRKTIAYDRTSINTDLKKALRWYAVHPYDSRSGGVPGTFYRSEDGGNTWNKLFDHSLYEKIYDLKTHPSDGKTVYMATEDGLFFSSDKGDTFSKLGDLPTGEVMSVEVNPKDPSIIFATVKDDGVYRSNNGGLNFTEVRNDLAYFLFMNQGYPNLLYMVPQSRVGANLVVSRDGGDTWTKSGYFEEQPGLGRNYKIVIRGQFTGIVPNPLDSTDAVAFSNAQFRKTDDAGVTFDVSSDYFTGFAWGWGNQSMIFDPYDPNRFVTLNADVGMILTETGSDYFEDRGVPTSWRQGTNPLIPWTSQYNGDMEPVQGSKKIVTSAGYTFDTKVAFTADEGVNWTLPTVVESEITTGYNEYHLFVKYHSTNPNIIYAGNKISTDGGLTFMAMPYLDNINGSIFGMCEKSPEVIYAINRNTSRNKIYRSEDHGQNWSLYANPGYSFTPLDSRPVFNVHPTDPYKVYAVCNGSMPGVERGDMAVFDGNSWKGLGVIRLAGSTEYGNFVNKITFDPKFPNIMYVCMFSHGVDNIWRSVDDGKTWMNISYNFPRIGNVGLKVNPHTGELFTGTAAGTWILPPPYKSANTIYNKNYKRPYYYYYALPACYTGTIIDQKETLPTDNLIVRIYNASDNQLVGEGITKDGCYFIAVETDEPGTADDEGTPDSSEILVKLLIDNTEYPLYTDSLATQTTITHESGKNKEINLWLNNSVLGVNSLSTEKAYLENYPNPVNSVTTIKYFVPQSSRVTLSVYNSLGQEIRKLADGLYQSGLYEVKWNGTDDGNHTVPDGLYICRLKTEDLILQQKMVLIK